MIPRRVTPVTPGAGGVARAFRARLGRAPVPVTGGVTFCRFGGQVLALLGPAEVFRGGCSGHRTDPVGQVWDVATNPLWPLGPDGSRTLAPSPAAAP
ncbi:MAG: hypothetical protein KJZ85_09220 [Rhodobacteraceae bacterium]|jgi:hypothetical protein|nr:hypothetical protein [Paracoccaceae bacterium]